MPGAFPTQPPKIRPTQGNFPMNTARSILAREIARFERWAASLTGPRSGEWECGYSHWPARYTAVDRMIAAVEVEHVSNADVSHLLQCLARDNECEHIAKQLDVHPGLLFVLAQAALASVEPDAKWQLAERLGRRDDRREEAEHLLLQFVRDDDEYVSRRALLALSRLGSRQTETLAGQAWATGHEYQRIAAQWALGAVASPRLAEYLALARQDGRPFLLHNAMELGGA